MKDHTSPALIDEQEYSKVLHTGNPNQRPENATADTSMHNFRRRSNSKSKLAQISHCKSAEEFRNEQSQYSTFVVQS